MNNTIFEAVIFDMDGVVIDTRKPIEAFWIALGNKHQIAITQELMETRIHGCPARQTINALFGNLSEAQKEEIFEEGEEFETSMEYIAMAGVKSLLQSLKANQIPTALVTSSLRPKVDKVINHLALEGLFEVIVTSDLVKIGKPDPACYVMAAEKLGKNPASCVVFEDAVSGVKAAIGAGMLTVGVGTGMQEKLLKETGAIDCKPDFHNVAIRNHKNSLELVVSNHLSLELSASQYITR
ncbi:HAD family phosphatase [Rhodocytophaga rosea]|uniref:HAD family phosphatase n=1 Tax=Rhodocytophaga rosea TaxID=2704465 RepID=A0A6C0GUI1_9BACT|nr:HAD family phosphatase [Rhodocytophaga rosea]QHT71012.1 HAD family phosphatase [Rhodocytophaga rosea]